MFDTVIVLIYKKMISNIVYDIFIEEIKKKFPGKNQIASELAAILFLEKEAIYRRLRGEVPFTFAEIVDISLHLSISLDEIVSQDISVIPWRSFLLCCVDFIEPKERDYEVIQKQTDYIGIIAQDSESEIGWIADIITLPLNSIFEHLYNFYLFKWNYQFKNSDTIKKFGEIKSTDRLRSISIEKFKRIKQFEKTVLIFNDDTIIELINDICYFVNACLITKEEAFMLKSDLHLLMDDLEGLAMNGVADTGKKVDIYISPLKSDSSYAYFKSKNHQLTLIRSLTINGGYSTDKHILKETENLTSSLMRTATLISETGAVERIKFFEKQRMYLEKCIS